MTATLTQLNARLRKLEETVKPQVRMVWLSPGERPPPSGKKIRM